MPVEARTAVLEIRCDARDLAALLLFYTRSSVPIRSRSDLVATALADFVGFLAECKEAVQIENTADAIALLDKHFGEGAATHAGRGRVSQILQMQRESLGAPLSVRRAKHSRDKTVQEFMQTSSEFDLTEAARRIEELMVKGEAKFLEDMNAGKPLVTDTNIGEEGGDTDV